MEQCRTTSCELYTWPASIVTIQEGFVHRRCMCLGLCSPPKTTDREGWDCDACIARCSLNHCSITGLIYFICDNREGFNYFMLYICTCSASPK